MTIPAVGTAEPLPDRPDPRTDDRPVEHGALRRRAGRPEGAAALHARPAAVPGGAVAGRGGAGARHRDGEQRRAAEGARYEDLYKRGLIPRDQYETQRASNESLQATLAADRAAVDNAKLNLGYTRIIAPISGRTGALGVHDGDLVRANDATPLVVINQVSPIYVTFSVPGRYLGDIRRYQAQKPLVVTARGQAPLRAGRAGAAAAGAAAEPGAAGRARPGRDGRRCRPGLVETGRVSFIDNSVDATTGTIKLKGTFQNADQGLWPGLFVQVTLQPDDRRERDRRAGDRGAAVGVRPVRLRRRPDRTARGASGDGRAPAGEEMIIAKGLSPARKS